jgi:hypothetical protein
MYDSSFKQCVIEDFAHTMMALVHEHERAETNLLRIVGARQVGNGYETSYVLSDSLADLLQTARGTKLILDRQFSEPGEHMCDVYTDKPVSIFETNRVEILAALTQLKRMVREQ